MPKERSTHKTRAGYEIHPGAAIFPVLPDDELEELADDIRVNGLQQPIVRDASGVIIDGRNRLLACLRAGVEPRFTELPTDADPVAYILGANIARRHMTKGQRAMAVAKARDLSPEGTTVRAAADAAAVGKSHLSRAVTVLEHAPELVDDVLVGVRSLNEAYAVARARKDPATAGRRADDDSMLRFLLGPLAPYATVFATGLEVDDDTPSEALIAGVKHMAEIEAVGTVQWWLGDWFVHGERAYGKTDREMAEEMGMGLHEVRALMRTAKQFPPDQRSGHPPMN